MVKAVFLFLCVGLTVNAKSTAKDTKPNLKGSVTTTTSKSDQPQCELDRQWVFHGEEYFRNHSNSDKVSHSYENMSVKSSIPCTFYAILLRLFMR